MLLRGNCLELLAEMPDNSVDSIVTDPPYELGFMGKAWDNSGIAYSVQLWTECLRVLKPGGHLLAFGGSRTYHRLACAVEDAGFEVRDQIMWLYGSGFPKSLDVSKAIEGKITTGSSNKKDFKNLTGEQVERGNWGIAKAQQTHGQRDTNYDETAGDTRLGKLEPTTPEAQQWQGWGTALKPAHEPIVVARKPLTGTVASNVLEWGTGALNIDASRVGEADGFGGGAKATSGFVNGYEGDGFVASTQGRWPANVIHDGSDEVLEGFPITASTGNGSKSGHRKGGASTNSVGLSGVKNAIDGYADGGSAARYFYCAKASKSERNAGLEGLPEMAAKFGNQKNGEDLGNGSVNDKFTTQPAQNFHPTVKPLALMRYLVKMVTPPGGTVLDPFLGSGTTACAAIMEGFEWIGCEMTEDYWPIIKARTAWAEKEYAKQVEAITPDAPTLF